MSEESLNQFAYLHITNESPWIPLSHIHRTTSSAGYQQSLEDLQYARSIQSMMAPTAAQLDALFPECMVYDRPMDKLSGDFFLWPNKTKWPTSRPATARGTE